MTDTEALRALLAKATPGPWYATDIEYPDGGMGAMQQDGDGQWTVTADPAEAGWHHDGGCPGYGISEANAKLIAAMRDALPAMLDELDRLRAANRRENGT